MEKRENVVFLTSHELIVQPSTTSSQFRIIWDGVHLEPAFEQIKRSGIDKTQLLLGIKESYTFCLPAGNEKPTRESLLARAKTLVPEDLTDHNFDWSIVHDQIQIIAVSPFLLEAITQASKATRVSVEAISTLPSVLARMTAGYTRPSLVVWQDGDVVISLCHKGVVYFSQVASEKLDEDVSRIVQWAEHNYRLSCNTVISNIEQPLLLKDLYWEKIELPALDYLSGNPVLPGDDATSLLLRTYQESLDQMVEEHMPVKLPSTKFSWKWILASLAMLAIIAICIIIVINLILSSA